MGLPLKDSIIQVAVDPMKPTVIVNLFSPSALCPSHLWLRNNLGVIKHKKRKLHVAMDGTKRIRARLAPRREHANSTHCLWAPEVCIMRTLQAKFSADVTRFSHTIFINGPGNPAVETSALCWEFSLLFYIPQSHKWLLCKCQIA